MPSSLPERVAAFATQHAQRWSEKNEYSRFEPDHVFEITVGDHAFSMSFADYAVGGTIVQRIEGRREPDTVALIEALVHPGMAVLELGGCYGYFTLIMSSCVGPSGHIRSIEGTPNNFSILNKNLRLNEVGNVQAVNVFVTSRSPTVTYGDQERAPYNAIGRIGTASPIPEGAAGFREVPAIVLSNYLNAQDYHPGVVFMDIEGFEAEVIDDLAGGYLATHQPTLVFELHPKFYAAGRGEQHIRNTLVGAGYICRRSGDNMIALPIRNGTQAQ
jgi:FkbM family methyltransferase